jgi:hypothetical protein
MLAMRDAHPLRYTLTWQDALAYERLPKTIPGIQQATLYIWLALAGILLIALPPEVVGDTGSPRFWLTGAGLLLLQYAIFRLGRAVMRLNRARYRLPRPVEMELGEADDHLVVSTDGKPRTVPFTEIGMLLPAKGHLFMSVGRDLIIVPASAFVLPDSPQHMASRIDAFMREKYQTGLDEETEGDGA